MELSAFFPVTWNFGDRPSDGLGGKPVDDGGLIYVHDMDDDSDTFEEVLYVTSIKELVDEELESHFGDGSNPEAQPDGLVILAKIKKALLDSAEEIDEYTGVKAPNRDKIEEISRANTLLTLQNEALEGQVLLLMNDISVLNEAIGKEQAI